MSDLERRVAELERHARAQTKTILQLVSALQAVAKVVNGHSEEVAGLAVGVISARGPLTFLARRAGLEWEQFESLMDQALEANKEDIPGVEEVVIAVHGHGDLDNLPEAVQQIFRRASND